MFLSKSQTVQENQSKGVKVATEREIDHLYHDEIYSLCPWLKIENFTMLGLKELGKNSMFVQLHEIHSVFVLFSIL